MWVDSSVLRFSRRTHRKDVSEAGKCLLGQCAGATSGGATPHKAAEIDNEEENGSGGRQRQTFHSGFALVHNPPLFISKSYSRMKEVVKAAVESMRRRKGRRKEDNKGLETLQPEEEQTGFRTSAEATVVLQGVGVGVAGHC